jgi:hypothetical protein
MNFSAVFPPMTTPFRDGEVDASAIETNINKWLTAGVGGVVALGSNGEAALLEEDESDRVIAAAPRRSRGIGCSSPEPAANPRATPSCEPARGALGADAVWCAPRRSSRRA